MTLVQRFLLSLPALAFLMLPVFRAGANGEAWINLVLAIIIGTVAIPFIILEYLRFRYWITPQEVGIRRGVLRREHRNIPIERIHTVEIEQSLLPRLFGMAKVKMMTAGSTKAEGVLEYVGLEEAARIREIIRSYQRGQAAAPAVALEPAADTPPAETPLPANTASQTLFEMPLKRVLLSGVFRFSLLYIALAFSALQYLGVDEDAVVDWLTRGRFKPYLEPLLDSPWLAAAFAIGSAMLFAWLTGILVNLNKFYQFRLWLDVGKLQKRHGLLTRLEGTIPIRRIQTLVVRTNPLMRRYGWHALELQTMGLDPSETGNQAAMPFARQAEIETVAPHLYPFTLPEVFARVSPLHIRRLLVRYTVALLVVVAPVGYFWTPAWGGLALWPLLAVLAYFQYRNHGYALDDGLLFVRKGVIRQQTWVMPVEKMQVFFASASFFQRRLGLKSVYADTAGGGALVEPEIADLPAATADALLETLYERFQRHFEADQPAPASPE